MADRRKPLSFDTTIRSPERLARFASIISEYENYKLSKELIIEIEAKIIQEKLFIPQKQTLGTYKYYVKSKNSNHIKFIAHDKSISAPKKVEEYFNEWKNNPSGHCDLNKIIYLLKNTVTNHKEQSYNYGWSSRLYTQTIFLNELGFIYLVPGQKIRISKNGKDLISEYKNGYHIASNDSYNYYPEWSAYLNAFSKYQTNNPWRHNTIKVNFLKLVLQTFIYLRQEYKLKNINVKVLSFLITWDSNKYKELGDIIYKFINKYSTEAFNNNERLYSYALNMLDPSTNNFGEVTSEFKRKKQNDYKKSKIIHETTDDVMRKLKYTKLISHNINNRLSINTDEQHKINYIINSVSNNDEVENDKLLYFQYMGTNSNELRFNENAENSKNKAEIKQNALNEWTKKMDWDKLNKEFIIAGKDNRNNSKEPVLKYIDPPTRMEFLSAITIKKALPKAQVIPHYVTDDKGTPYRWAPGRQPDIDVYHNGVKVLLEPTKGTRRSFQTEHEIPSITNHYKTAFNNGINNQSIKDIFAIFLAPKIANPDVSNKLGYYNNYLNYQIYPYTFEDYIKISKNIKDINDYKQLKLHFHPIPLNWKQFIHN